MFDSDGTGLRSPAELVAAAVSVAAALPRDGWSGVTRSEELLGLMAARDRLDAFVVALTAECDACGDWSADGALSPVAWLAHRAPVTRQEASTLVRTARHVAANERTAKALDGGDITAAHATIAARAAKHREDHYAEHEDVILDAASALTPSDFRAVMQHWRLCADAVSDLDDARDQVEGNYLDISTTFEGVGHLDGRLDPVSTATLMRVLDQVEGPDPLGGTTAVRTLSQRRAAALVRLACGDTPPRVGIDISVDADTFAGRTSSDLTEQCCEISGFGPVSPAVVRTLACDAAIGRVLVRGTSEVLDLGRRTRMITPALRRSLELRDRGCVEPGCTAPAAWCDGHHIVHWTHHGETALHNLELRCRRHHVLQHQRDLARQQSQRE